VSRVGRDSLALRRTLTIDGREVDYFSLPAVAEAGLGDPSRLPFSLKVLLENLLRFEDGGSVSVDDIRTLAGGQGSGREIAYRPSRVLMQDFTGVPAVVDLAAMRDAVAALGGDPKRINPLVPVDLVIDHSVQVDNFGSDGAFVANVEIEMRRNHERYAFLRWGQQAFENFRVVPPGTGICHQVNLEYLSQTVWSSEDAGGRTIAYPDTVVGTDSHTTMVNGVAVLAWGVGGIEAEAAMLGQPISMLIPEVVGVRLTGALPEAATTTDLVLTLTAMLRAEGVVGKFVEYTGPGIDALTVADRATIANMAPEYGATCGFFPIDQATVDFLAFTGRDPERCRLVEAYAKAQGMWREADAPAPTFTKTLALDLGTIEASLAGPKRPQDRVALSAAASSFDSVLSESFGRAPGSPNSAAVAGADFDLEDGAVTIAAITSCTNTSNPGAMIGAGLVARNARAKGLSVKPWVKTSLAPGSKVVSDYLERAGLQDDLDALGFNLVGYGCTTCIGNSGPLPEAVGKAIDDGDLVVTSVLSGNRNFEGRVHQQIRANYLASPPLVVAYALAGSLRDDITTASLGEDTDGKAVTLADIWPSRAEVAQAVTDALTPEMYGSEYADVFSGDADWQAIATSDAQTYDWPESTYVANPPYFAGMPEQPGQVSDIAGARILAMLGDSVTTDHISPAGGIARNSPAGDYLVSLGVEQSDFNSYGARRGNHQVMMRGTFANIRLRNEMAPGTEGSWTRLMPSGQQTSIFEASVAYSRSDTPLVVVAGKEYGTGSSRDWAAKGPSLLGVRVVIAESYERIHRSNLVGMGILPLQFKDGESRKTLGLDGSETLSFDGLAAGLKPRMEVPCSITAADGSSRECTLICRIDTDDEVGYFRNGGILHTVLRQLAAG
jgi:aconitate hydratase